MKKFDIKSINKKRIIIDQNGNFLFDNFDGELDLTIQIKANINATLSFASFKEIKGKVDIYLDNDCRVEIYYADFASNHVQSKINLFLKNGAHSVFHLASLAGVNSNKNVNVCAYHEGPNSYSFVDNYGVVRENGKLVFDGVSYIKNGSIKSKTRQNAKIMVFDKESIGIAKPILKIDENDIEASHGAVVGKISDEHLFYLTSRGLSEEKAKTLITYGYLKPILIGFDDNTKAKIEKLIEGRI